MAPTKNVILIVDDDPITSMVRERQITQAFPGFSVDMVESLEAAKTRLAKGGVAAVVTDNDFYAKAADPKPTNNMGIELVRHIRATDKDMPILWNSGRFKQQTLDDLGKAATGSAVGPLAAGVQSTYIDAHTMAIEKNLPNETQVIQGFLTSQLGISGHASGLPPMGGGGGGGRGTPRYR